MFKLSYTSKMRCYSWDLPARLSCPVQSEVCAKCYGVRGNFLFKESAFIRIENLKGLRAKGGLDLWKNWFKYELLNRGVQYFRFHSTGDLYSIDYYTTILAVCKELPKVSFWIPTHNYKVVAERLNIPRNVCVSLSSLPGTEQEERVLHTKSYMKSHGTRVNLSYMIKDFLPKNVNICPCSGSYQKREFKSCDEACCYRCWHTGENVGFLAH